ncbi:hypothetical protein [Ramlibacter henchirensis]|uniref:hypothetical protein n=1 Tax=Ramlibacter henchirensis TaxID=204072 RepID=UPI00142F9AC4|nr:hypothetical protein [Ramlibacter henchirensis]
MKEQRPCLERRALTPALGCAATAGLADVGRGAGPGGRGQSITTRHVLTLSGSMRR